MFLEEMLSMNDMVNLLVNNGIAVVVVGYFLVRDWKYNADMVVILHEIKQLLELMKKEDD